MSRFFALLSMAWVSLALLGCGGGRTIIVVHEPPRDLPPDAEVVYVDDDVAIAEINAVRNLQFDSGRTDHLLHLAHRPNLGHQAQVHLIITTLDVLDFDSLKTSVLSALAKNPTLCPQAKRAMLEQVGRLQFDSNRTQVMRLLAKNPGAACGACLHETQAKKVVLESEPSLN